MTDLAGRAVVIGSACRWTIFQPSSSRAMIIVARRLMGVTASSPPTLALARSTLTRYASSGVTCLVTVSPSTISPSRSCDAAWSTTAPTCSHPRTKGPNGLPRVTVLAMGVTLLYGFGISFQELTRRHSELLDEVVNVVLRSHLDRLSFCASGERYGQPLSLRLPIRTLTTLRSTRSARIGPDTHPGTAPSG
jgi:hypothetical protein